MLKSYLTQTSLFGCFGWYQSNYENIDVRVSQGSVLGPLLFLIYVNDLQNINSLKVLNFADDTLLHTNLTKTLTKKIVPTLL